MILFRPPFSMAAPVLYGKRLMARDCFLKSRLLIIKIRKKGDFSTFFVFYIGLFSFLRGT